jgi:ubiquinone/menaquinone biosynthesis C-methylase UbiE
MSESVVDKVASHYAPEDLRDRVAAVLKAAGKDSSNTKVEHLVSLDQSHVMGDVPNRRLAETAGVRREHRVLDVGCGMGGPARLLAATYGCRVTGIDVTEPYLETAELLTELTNLTELVSVQRGDALDLPFDDETFDIGWTQHALQNFPDKTRFFGEFNRVLKPGAKAVVHDLYRGPSGEVHFPALWGEDESVSFLDPDTEIQRVMQHCGFRIVHWEDTTQEAWDSNAQRAEGDLQHRAREPGVPGLDISLLHGERWMELAGNSVKDFEVGAIGIFEAVLEKP